MLFVIVALFAIMCWKRKLFDLSFFQCGEIAVLLLIGLCGGSYFITYHDFFISAESAYNISISLLSAAVTAAFTILGKNSIKYSFLTLVIMVVMMVITEISNADEEFKNVFLSLACGSGIWFVMSTYESCGNK